MPRIVDHTTFFEAIRPLYNYFDLIMDCDSVIGDESKIGYDQAGRIVLTLRIKGEKLPYMIFGMQPHDWQLYFSYGWTAEQLLTGIVEAVRASGIIHDAEKSSRSRKKGSKSFKKVSRRK